MKYALITGAESGLARAVIKKLIEEGYFVFAADISYKDDIKKDNIYYIKCDVTSNGSISSLFVKISTVTHSLNVVSNFAGKVILGSLIELKEEDLSNIFNINLISNYKINRLAYPFIKEGEGRYIIISSEYGKITGLPFHGYYTITKHALDAYIDSLRRELASSNIKVIGIRPGAFKTNMQQSIDNQFNNLVNDTLHYKKPLLKMQKMMKRELVGAKDPDLFAKKYLKILKKKHPQNFYNIKNSFKMKLFSLLSNKQQDIILNKFFK